MSILRHTNKIFPEMNEVVGKDPIDALHKARKLRDKRKAAARKARKQIA